MATHLLRCLCHHGDWLAIFHPIRAGFTQTSVEPGVPKTDKHRALGTGSFLSPFSHTPADGGQAHLVHLNCILGNVTQIEGKEALESQQRAASEVNQPVVPSTECMSAAGERGLQLQWHLTASQLHNQQVHIS